MLNRSRNLSSILITGLLLIYSGCSQQTNNKGDHIDIDRFISINKCGSCHQDIYRMWKGSMHSLSDEDPVYLDVANTFLAELEDSDEIQEAESCVKCHTPIGYFSGNPLKLSNNRSEIPDKAKEGVQCDFCHSAIGAKHMYNNEMIIDPGQGIEDPGIKRGPFNDSSSTYHESEYSEFHLSAQVCGTCHNVRHEIFGTKIESTYDEWLEGPYNRDDPEIGINCLGCHMYQRKGVPGTANTERPENPGRASGIGPERDHIFTHYFVGANELLPQIKGDMERMDLVRERMTNAADISIKSNDISDKKILILISNTGCGHYIPTGLTSVRQMWLEVILKDTSGRIIYESGKTDTDGYLAEDSIIFNTVFGDGNGNAVQNVAKAKEILFDKRIPPGESVEETIIIPDGDWRELNISVRLLYRSVSQKQSDKLYGKGEMIIPIITMEELSDIIKF